ncbi:MAG: hypothetical protein PHV68_02205 [Candidatus Gastranaerophilales bacterium]|nr:hypothetical protein [Candidatus Gastranaerophilales bacterium]
MLDGISIANSNLYQPITPTELTSQAEQSAKNEAQTVIKELREGEKTKLDKETEENKDEKTNAEGRYTDNEEEQQAQNDIQIVDKKKYKVKFNNLTDMVELIDYTTDNIVETISPGDLLNIISNSKNLSGILVDRKI